MRASRVRGLGLALERGEAKRGGFERCDRGVQGRIRGLRRAALLPQQQSLRFAVQRTARELAGRLQPLEGAGLVGKAGDDQQRLRCGSDPQMKAIAGLAHFARVEARAARRRAASPANPPSVGASGKNTTALE